MESMMGLRPRQGNLRLVFSYYLVLCEACRAYDLNNLKTSLRFFLSRLQPRHLLFFSPIIFSKTEYPLNSFKSSWGNSYNLQATFLFIVLTCVLISPCACILHDWQLISYLLWHFLYITGCQVHILHEIHMAVTNWIVEMNTIGLY